MKRIYICESATHRVCNVATITKYNVRNLQRDDRYNSTVTHTHTQRNIIHMHLPFLKTKNFMHYIHDQDQWSYYKYNVKFIRIWAR